MSKSLRLVLGDQLNYHHSWLDEPADSNIFIMMEIKPEATYVKHHIQKLIGFFAAMRSYHDHLENKGFKVIYYQLSDTSNAHSFEKNIQKAIEEGDFDHFYYQEPDEYRLDEELKALTKRLSIPSECCSSEHFLTDRGDLEKFFKGKKTYLMESFYRDMRKKFDVLMNGTQPEGEKWNYDHENRKKLPKGHEVKDANLNFTNLTDIEGEINKMGISSIGSVAASRFIWPVSRRKALNVLEYFLDELFENYGKYQDAMDTEHKFIYHSRISFALNTKMLHPLEVIQAAEKKWKESDDALELSAVEGFIRQILGWREYMRGVYWAKMPQYSEENFFKHERKLPAMYWTGETKMNCLKHAISQSLSDAYAHHIQRLMITGNFALLMHTHPDEVDEWYLGIYIDAIEWVEITNTRGMSQWADGGLLATKPYISSANYIHKMSNYCTSCHYDKAKKYGDKACPFNSLYWYFFETHRDKLKKNARVAMMYNTLDRMKPDEKEKIFKQAEAYLDKRDEL
ncbi:MAG: cryptochrome/photolyase family protein [Cyclobacteriaceae bacterium]|nr:cryptochrome/photolyase family protein [Cyclobacteriaceae bacterium]MCH8515609.1 cryptochrome/photolyase family protein [Cyclobacteriaceae bacterium]